jgi:hypothetical protein
MPRTETITITSIVAIIGLFLTYQYYNGVFDHPQILFATQDEKHCPSRLLYWK